MIRAIIETLSCIRSKHKKTDYLLTLFKMSLCFFCSIADETFRGDFKTYDDNLLCTFENSEFYCGNYFASSFWPSSQLQIIQLTAVRKVAVSLNKYRQIIEGMFQLSILESKLQHIYIWCDILIIFEQYGLWCNLAGGCSVNPRKNVPLRPFRCAPTL